MLGTTLADAELRFHAVVESLAEGLAIFDSTGVLVFCNSQFEQLTGYTREEIFGKRIYEIFFPEGSPEQDQYLRDMLERYRARQEGVREVYLTHIYRKNGERRFVETKAAPLIDREGRILGSIGANTDVTDRMRMEERIQRSNRIETMGQLAGGIARDFNNLLTTIRGRADLALEKENCPADIAHELRMLKVSAEAASRLTRQLSVLSHQTLVRMEPTDLNEILRETEPQIRSLLSAADTLELSFGKLSPVLADTSQIQQLFLDLAMFCLKRGPHTGQTTRRLLLETKEHSFAKTDRIPERLVPGKYVLFRMTASGTSIEAARIPDLLEPFSTAASVGGEGFALSASLAVVTQLGGDIMVEAQSGGEISFEIFLPALAAQLSLRRSAKHHERSYHGHQHIVVLDQDRGVRQLLSDVLTRHSYSVTASGEPSEVFQLLRTTPEPPNLLIADMGGAQAGDAEKLRAILTERPEVKVLLLAGQSFQSEILEILGEHSIPVLSKPFSPEALLVAVRSILEILSRRRANARGW